LVCSWFFFLEMLKLFEDATFASFLSKQIYSKSWYIFGARYIHVRSYGVENIMHLNYSSKLAEVNKHVPWSNTPDSQYDQWNASDQIGNKEAPILSQIISEDLNICFLFIWTSRSQSILQVLHDFESSMLNRSSYLNVHIAGVMEIVIPQGAGLQGRLRIQWYRQP
jgi:hypothetical protein